LTSGYAFWSGGPPERIGAAIFLVGSVLTYLAGSAVRWSSVEVGIFAVDVAGLVAFALLALRAERFWPLWLTVMQAVATAGHVVKLVEPDVLRWGYAFALAIWSYPMLALIVAGTWCHRRRLKRYGADISWSSSFARSETRPNARPTASSTSSAA
ncbi:MAG TPA: hypothetical protein VEW25_02360, partial [Allosphingosinicella sp.]|nr:hypothetical protein [Allosphingosinicella sp.]